MGYNTEFFGTLTLSPPLTERQIATVNQFAKTRHGGNTDTYIVPHSYWCQWVVTEDGKQLKWDGVEKFYGYVHWLHHLNEIFFFPWQITLSGTIKCKGEYGDRTTITAVPAETNGYKITNISPPKPVYKPMVMSFGDSKTIYMEECRGVEPSTGSSSTSGGGSSSGSYAVNRQPRNWKITCKKTCGWAGTTRARVANTLYNKRCPQCKGEIDIKKCK